MDDQKVSHKEVKSRLQVSKNTVVRSRNFIGATESGARLGKNTGRDQLLSVASLQPKTNVSMKYQNTFFRNRGGKGR